MKIDIKATSLFPAHQKEIQDYFHVLTQALSKRFEVLPAVFNNLSGMFESFLALNREHEHIAPLMDATSRIVQWLYSMPAASLKETYATSSEFWREANDSFWSMSNSNPETNPEYTFRENVDKRFDTIYRVLEFMIKKEGYLICRLEHTGDDVPEKFDLTTSVERCMTFLGRFPGLAVKEVALKQIPLNQWRNISAHKNFTCNGNKITVTYGRNAIKSTELTWEEIESACVEIYRMRINIKIIACIVLIVLAARDKELLALAKISPKTALLDINYFFESRNFSITRFELLKELVIQGQKPSIPEGLSVFNVEFDHNEETDAQLVAILQAVAAALAAVFGDHNSLPPKEKVVLHFNSTSRSSEFHLIYTFV
jgi:hypothetical protein